MNTKMKIACLATIAAASHSIFPISGANASTSGYDIPALSAKIPHKAVSRADLGATETSSQPDVVRIPMLEGITLTQDQKNSVRSIIADLRSHLAGQGEKSDKIRKDINATLGAAGKIDIDRLQSLMKQEQDIRGGVELAQAKAMAQIHNLLTPAQIEQGVKTRQEIAKLTAQIRALENGATTAQTSSSPTQNAPSANYTAPRKP